MPPMTPMPYAAVSVVCRRVKRVAGRSPLPAGFLAHQNEARSARTRHLPESRRNELTPPTQRIHETLHRLGQLRCPTGSDPMMLPPGLEQLGDVLAIRVVRFQHFEPLDGISTTKGQQRIAHPIAPGLKAAQRPAAFEPLLILPAVSPDRQSGRQ